MNTSRPFAPGTAATAALGANETPSIAVTLNHKSMMNGRNPRDENDRRAIIRASLVSMLLIAVPSRSCRNVTVSFIRSPTSRRGCRCRLDESRGALECPLCVANVGDASLGGGATARVKPFDDTVHADVELPAGRKGEPTSF